MAMAVAHIPNFRNFQNPNYDLGEEIVSFAQKKKVLTCLGLIAGLSLIVGAVAMGVLHAAWATPLIISGAFYFVIFTAPTVICGKKLNKLSEKAIVLQVPKERLNEIIRWPFGQNDKWLDDHIAAVAAQREGAVGGIAPPDFEVPKMPPAAPNAEHDNVLQEAVDSDEGKTPLCLFCRNDDAEE